MNWNKMLLGKNRLSIVKGNRFDAFCLFYYSLGHSLQGVCFWANWHVLEINHQRTTDALQEFNDLIFDI